MFARDLAVDARRDAGRGAAPVAARAGGGFRVVATLFFALGNAILIIPLGLVPSWLALASTGFDVALLGVAVALWDAFDEGQALRADMMRSVAATGVLVVLFGGQALIGLAVVGPDGSGRTALTVLLFTSLALAIAIHVLLGHARRAARPGGVLAIPGTTGRPRRAAQHRGGPAAAQGRPARRHRRRHVRPPDPPRARPLRRPVEAGGQPSDGTSGNRRATGPARRARPAAGTSQRAEGCFSPTASPGSSHVTAATSAPPTNGVTTTRSISRMWSACVRTRRTRPRPASTQSHGGPGSGSSPKFRSGHCTTGRTRPPG